MDLSKLKYSKKNSDRTPADVPLHKLAIEGTEEGGTSKTLDVSPAYQKLEGVLPTSLVFVLSGGEKREKDFLHELMNDLHSLRVAFMSEKGQGLQPYQMQDKWLQIQSNGEIKIGDRIFHLENMDKVFLLTDVDEFYDQLKKISKDNSDEAQGQWIVSNPCFEIWLYYCYLNDPEKDLKCLETECVTIRSQKLKALCNTLVKGGMNPRRAFEHMNEGIEHSKVHYNVDTNGIPVLFATQMHEMAQYLVDTMNNNANEYLKYVEMQKERRRSMKEKILR